MSGPTPADHTIPKATREEVAATASPNAFAAPLHMAHDDVTTDAPQQIIAGLEAEFPGWRVWRTTDAGTWWASRCGSQWMREPRTLAADTANGLRHALSLVRAAP